MLFPILACVLHGERVAGASALARGARVRVGARSRGRAVREPPLRLGSGAHEGEGVRGGPLRVASTGSGRTDLGGARAVGCGGCDRGRRRPAPRPCPGFPRERERRWGVWWDALARGVRVRVGGPWPALAGGRFANRPYDRGVCGVAGVRGGPLRVPSAQAQGERIWEGRLQRGVGEAMGDGDAPRRTSLGSCLRRNDARAVGSGGCDGGRRRPAPRPCPGFPRERERRWAGATSGGGIRRLGRMWSPGPGRRPTRSPRWRRRGRGRCRR